jgi:hypothetical protein
MSSSSFIALPPEWGQTPSQILHHHLAKSQQYVQEGADVLFEEQPVFEGNLFTIPGA